MEVFAFREYEPFSQLLNGALVVDIGAHVGSFALRVHEVFPLAEFICCEPDPEAFKLLSYNLMTNGVPAKLHQVAVTDRTGVAALYRSQPGAPTNRVADKPGNTTCEVRSLSLGELMLTVDRDIALMKLDCEGSEYRIVRGSSDRAWAPVQRIVMERHPAGAQEQAALRRRLGDLGFRTIRQTLLGPDCELIWLSRVD
jgi:FkbM family methyltransferase